MSARRSESKAASARLLGVMLGVLTSSACGSPERVTQLVVTVSAPDAALGARLQLVVASLYPLDASDERSPGEQRRFAIASASPKQGEFTLPFSFGVIKGESESVKLVITGYEDPERQAVIEHKAIATFRAGQQVPVYLVLHPACYRLPAPCTGLAQTCAPLDTAARRAGTCGPVEAASTTERDGDDAGMSPPEPDALPTDGGMTPFSSAEPCAVPGTVACTLARECEGGRGLSCTMLGSIYGESAPVLDPARAASLFQRGCELGDLDGCRRLAYALETGSGIAMDGARALQLYTSGCERNHLKSCRMLGKHAMDGTLGLMRDDARALELFVRGCDGGELESCNDLGMLHQQGRGVPQDAPRARSLYQRACEGSVAVACTNLGSMMASGQGGPQDYVGALELYTRACDAKDALGCNELGGLYEGGLGVAKNSGRALDLYRRACASRLPKACENVKRLAP